MDNFDRYCELTRDQDWGGICELNGRPMDSFGTKKELKVLHEYLEDDEVVFAIASGVMTQTETSNSFDFGTNTWLVVLTSQRFLLLDCAMLSDSVDTQSIRHERVQAVSSSQGFLLGKIMIDLGSRLVVIDNCQKADVSKVATLATQWLSDLERQSKIEKVQDSNTNKSDAKTEESAMDKLERAAKLHAIGALTDDEFSTLKSKILSKL